MKLVDTKDNKFVDANPATLKPGTPIPASSMNSIQDEIANVITGYGLTIDESNDAQMKAALDKNFAPINSPTLTGIPLTSNPDGTINNQIATVDYVNQKALQATVGFTPVQQSGGDNQGPNKIYIGADKTDSNQVRVQVDQTDRGLMVFQDNDSVTHGVDQIGFNIGGQTFAFRDRIDNKWRFSYTTDQIDAKAYIGSLPDGNNLKVSDIIWNSSSSLPALYYGTDNSVAYLATETWANTTFQPVGDYATNTALNSGLATKQATGNYARTDTSNTFNGNQKFNDTVTLADGRVLQTIGGVGGVIVNRYTDSSGVATTDLNNAATGANLSWFRLYQDGMLRTNIGDVVFNHRDIDYGLINGGYYIRVGNVITQYFVVQARDGDTISFPIQLSNSNVQLNLTSQYDNAGNGGSSIANFIDGTLTASSFKLDTRQVWNGGNGGSGSYNKINVTATGVL